MHASYLAIYTNPSRYQPLHTLNWQLDLNDNCFWGLVRWQYNCYSYWKVFHMRVLSLASKLDMHVSYLAIYTNPSRYQPLHTLLWQLYLNDNHFWGLVLLQYNCYSYWKVFHMRVLSLASKQDMHVSYLAIYTNPSRYQPLHTLNWQIYLNNNCFWGLALLEYTCYMNWKVFHMRSLSLASKLDMHVSYLACLTNPSTYQLLHTLNWQLYLNDNCFQGLALLQYICYRYWKVFTDAFTFHSVFHMCSLRLASKLDMHPA
jgi:uncharacterized protein YijF (DUF1287 family)